MKANAEKIIEIIKEEVNNPSVDTTNLSTSASLTSQGIDSLDKSSIFFSIEEEFNVQIPDEKVSELDSIDDIVNFINSAD